MSEKYRTLTDSTVDGLNDQINKLANEGYELDKYEQNNYYDGEWQGIAIMKRMDNPTSKNKALYIDGVSISLPTDDQIHEWVCREFNVTALDYDEDIRTQCGYLPDYLKKFAEWLKGNDR